MSNIYLDHAATTQTDPEVLQAMLPYFTEIYGNPSSMHSFGQKARNAINIARSKVAKAINAKDKEIFFTSGGTEGDNWAIIGAAYANEQKGKHLITTKVEHHAVLDSMKFLENRGFEVTYIGVDEKGLVDPEEIENAIRKDTILISVMSANNEVGTIMPVQKIGEIAKKHEVIFHTDAVQAVTHIDIDVEKLNVDILTLSAHKFYGPKGVGANYIRSGTKIFKYLNGGAQERNKRAGTENIAGIVGLGVAIEKGVSEMLAENTRLTNLRNRLTERMINEIPNVYLNGDKQNRLANNVNLCFAGAEGEALLVSLDFTGIAASSGSACMSGTFEPSYVLMAMGIDENLATSSIRFTPGKNTTIEDIDRTVEETKKIIERLKSISPY